MAHHVIEWDQECTACNATGLYVGMTERDGSAVVCRACRGTGHIHKRLEYDAFEGRKARDDIRRVLEINPGIIVRAGRGHQLEDFGGLSYEGWQRGEAFPVGSEMRQFVCPRWWYQAADYEKKPDWDWCRGITFHSCRHFEDKRTCWERWDREYGSSGREERT